MIPNKLTTKNLVEIIRREFHKEGFGNVPLDECMAETEILNKIYNRIVAKPCPLCEGKRTIVDLNEFNSTPHNEPFRLACPCCSGYGAVVLMAP